MNTGPEQTTLYTARNSPFQKDIDIDYESTDVDEDDVLSPVVLPCGRELPNRLVKAAMYEHLSSFLGGLPNSRLNALYATWAQGGWGMIITGNVQVSRKHLSLGADMVVPERISEEAMKTFRRLANAMKGHDVDSSEIRGYDDETRPLAIMQLNHTGRQSPNGLGGRWPFVQKPLSASATRVGSSSECRRGGGLLNRVANALLFQKALAMAEQDIKETMVSFVRGAHLAVESGFDGIQLHAAHGYLIAQFISRKTNRRTDTYAPPLAFLHEIVQAIRMTVPRDFIVGLKLNAADYVAGGFNEADAASHFAEIARWEWDGAGVDFIEVSGGDYESPEFMQSPSLRQVFFESLSCLAVKAVEQEFRHFTRRTPPLIMLTGGLRSRAQFSRVLTRRHAHLLGIARAAVLQPHLPSLLREYHEKMGTQDVNNASSADEELWSWETQPTPEPCSPEWWPRLVGAGVGMAWYVVAMHRLALGRRLPYGENWVLVLLEMYFGGLWTRWRNFVVLAIAVAAISLYFTR